MIRGLSGSLLSHDALEERVRTDLGRDLDIGGAAASRRRMAIWVEAAAADLGPASSARTVFDRVGAPLAEALGFRATLSGGSGSVLRATLEADAVTRTALIVTPWGDDLSAGWRAAVHHGISSGVRWCLCVNGPALRVIDARRTYTRRHAQWDLQATIADQVSFEIFRGLLRAEAFAGSGPALLDRAVAISEEHRASVRSSLQLGVEDALAHLVRAFSTARRGRGVPHPSFFDESLVVVYRVLFLLFAEARGLVPQWHPTYRDSYTIESLRPAVERLPRPRGLWESLQAIARLAHRGCNAGPLKVPPFNGRLFSPSHAPLAEASRLDDGTVRSALLALTTRVSGGGRQRISYADLGVEQLGGVYERLLDFEPGARHARKVQARASSGRRKATGSFYTPRSLTEYVVRRTLAPLVERATPEQVLSLRIVDPAMGSGAFLVAACRYLAATYETALVAEGSLASSDVTEVERAGFRRAIAQRCLYGVDINPMAVQLGRLSLWLATLSGDRPLTFLDHHLRAGNSLVGVSLQEIARRPWRDRARRGRAAGLPLFEWGDAEGAISAAVGPRVEIAAGSGDTLEQVRAKERMLAALGEERSPIVRWKTLADLWCAGWFQELPVDRSGATFGALADTIAGRPSSLPLQVVEPLLAAARAAAEKERFFHWTLEFPEVFFGLGGQGLDSPGFDAVLGNPPWEMLRGDSGDAVARLSAATASTRLTAFTRESGVYAYQGDGHANLYQLFLERALALTRRGGRIGFVLPSGFATDHGCAALRRHVLDHTAVDTFVSVENHDGLFPIHRGLRFLLLCAQTGSTTVTLPYRSGVRALDVLDALPDRDADPHAVGLPRALLERLSGEQLPIPEIRSQASLSLVSRIALTTPALGDENGWHVRFGRELNATDDRHYFVEHAAIDTLPVLEGKQIQPFAADVNASRFHLPARAAAHLLNPERTYGRTRLAYRDVASATNRLTLIAAVIPAGCVTTHTLFCLKDVLDEESQHFLCAMLNSFVANYMVRLRVGTHVTVAIVDRLPVPRPPRSSPAFRELAALGAAMARDPADRQGAVRLQGLAASLYGLTGDELSHVLDTFPLVDAGFRRDVGHSRAQATEAHRGEATEAHRRTQG